METLHMSKDSVQPDAQEKQEYEQYVKSVTPTHNLWAQMGKAFLTGGIICCIGQGILNYTGNVLGMDPQTSGSWCSLILVFVSVVLTALHIYPKIAKWGGAGALVPITGFANSVTAPAVEYRKEGQVFGIGCKIFTIAGPVILYGIFSSWVLGLFYGCCRCSESVPAERERYRSSHFYVEMSAFCKCARWCMFLTFYLQSDIAMLY